MTGAPRSDRAGTRGKPFEPGNPGRVRGSRNRVTAAMEALLDGEAEGLTRKAIDMALEGDTVALRLCLDRLSPVRKDAPIAVDLPPVKTVDDVVAASAATLAAVAEGEITPDQAGRVMALLTAHRAIIETASLSAGSRRWKDMREHAHDDQPVCQPHPQPGKPAAICRRHRRAA